MAPTTVIIVPYLDRYPEQQRSAQLDIFLRAVPAFLDTNHVEAIIIIAEQVGGPKFNRGLLLNAAYLWARAHDFPSYTVFHDVDLIPTTPSLARFYGDTGAAAARDGRLVHLASCWGRYDNGKGYIGGVLGIGSSVFERVNGFPNNYWGWGGEDDELFRRCVAVSTANPSRPVTVLPVAGSYSDLEALDLAGKLTLLRRNPLWKNMRKWEQQAEHAHTWRTNGIGQPDTWSVEPQEHVDQEVPGVKVVRIKVTVRPGSVESSSATGQ